MREELPRLSDKVVLVTGSSRGLGRRVAELAAEQGAQVVLNSATTSVDGRIVARAIRDAGGQAQYVCADMADEEQIAQVAELVRERFGRLDVLVHCAAGGSETRVVDADAEAFIRAMRINSFSLIALARNFAPLMPAGGKIVYMTSVGAVRAAHGYGVVGAAKAAGEALVRSLALELAAQRISVNALRASAFPSLSLRYFSKGDEWLEICENETPMGTPPLDKIAEATLLLCSGAADFVTGQVVTVDGGWLNSVHRPNLKAG